MSNVIAFFIGLFLGEVFGMITAAVLSAGGDDHDGL
jgi:hypothetical protein